MNEKLILVGVEGLDFDLLDRKLKAGVLPLLSRRVTDGELRPLVSPVPPASLAAWACLSSGVLPGRHGIFLPDEQWEGGVRQVRRGSWRFAPVWERLSDSAIATASVGWPGIEPGGDWDGTHVDPRHLRIGGKTRDDWPLPLDVAPTDLRDALRASRVHPSELPPGLAAPLLPSGDPPDPGLQARLLPAFARVATLQAALQAVTAAAPWQALFVHVDWLNDAAAALGIDVSELPDPAWALLDQLLAAMPAAACSLIVSPGRSGPGFALAMGAGFGPDALTTAASTLSVAPLVYRHFGFADRSLPPPLQNGSRPLRELSTGVREPALIRPHTGDADRLGAFGIALPVPDPAWRQRRLLAEAEMTMAADPDRAALLAEQALAAGGESVLALGILAAAAVAKGDPAPLPHLADRIAAIDPAHVWHDLTLGAIHALAGDAAGATPHLRRAGSSANGDDRLRAASLWLMLERNAEAARLFRDVLTTVPHHLGALLGLLSTETVRGIEAEMLLRRVLTLQPDHQPARVALADLLRSLGRATEAGRHDRASSIS